MRQLFTGCCLFVFFFAAAQAPPSSDLLGKTLVASFQRNNFGMLQPYLPTPLFYKSLGKEMKQRSNKEINEFLANSKKRLKENWEKIRDRVKKDSVDLSALIIKESLLYNPFQQSSMQGLLLVYAYKGVLYDDISVIVKMQAGKTWLLEIPNTESFLSMKDSSLRNSNQARSAIELAKPAFKESVKQRVRELVQLAQQDSMEAAGKRMVYHGPDITRDWKAALNMNDPGERAEAASRMTEIKQNLQGCPGYTFGSLDADTESEGYWIVQQVKCGQHILRFAFLQTKEGLLLGSLDME
ncbi:MAG: hypothetical protein HYZ15_08365 [Sphingobacteriales bacterium]|nr:hypothetical protein [Sphingobacteriales bacterium]